MRIYNVFLIGVFLLTLFSCKKKADPSAEDLGYTYFPINDGDYSLYSVEDTVFLGVGSYSVDSFFIKEEIHEPVVVEEEERYQLYVYYRKTNEDWKSYPDSVWTVFRTGGRIVRVRNNVRFVPLVFPLEIGKSWDGNISDSEFAPEQYYSISNLYRPYSYDDYHYPKTVTVNILNDASAINNYLVYEVYANDFGLTYKEEKIYNFDQAQVGEYIVKSGHHLTQKLILHGRYK